MKYNNLPAATLLIGHSFSHCNNCEKGVLPSLKTHEHKTGYGESGEEKGCEIKFTHVFSTYMGDAAEVAAQEMRPDLEFIPHKREEIER